MTEAVLFVENIHKSFDKNQAVRGISFALKKGEDGIHFTKMVLKSTA